MKKKKKKKIPGIDYKKTNEENQMIVSDNNPTKLSFYIEDVANKKTLIKLIKSIERMIRSSREYSIYIGILKTRAGLTRDIFFSNITISEVEIDFEMHHYPFTLYEVVQTVIIDLIKKKRMFSTFQVCDLVLNLHYKNLLGIVPLSKTTHEMAHKNIIFIPLDSVFGDYGSFVKIYYDNFTEGMKNKLNNYIERTEIKDYEKQNKRALRIKE